MIKREVNLDMFSALISSIIGQQISTKAATTVENRLIRLIGKINPKNINKVKVEYIQKCGMSIRKAEYIKNIGEMALFDIIDFETFKELSNKEFVQELIKIKGVGPWTAEMLLIHSLKRENVLSYKDLGIRKGIEKLHGIENLSKEKFKIYEDKYSPYGTVASIYLWEISKKE